MQRAYAALGLPYSSQATTQGQSQQSNPGQGQPAGPQNPQAQQQQQLQQQMRPINALGREEDWKSLFGLFTVDRQNLWFNLVGVFYLCRQPDSSWRRHNGRGCLRSD